MKATVTFTVTANDPKLWAEMYGGEQEANEAFAEFVRGQIEDRFGGGCSAHMDTFTREVDQ